MERAARGQHGLGRRVLSGAGGHRRRHRAELRLFQCALGHPGHGPGHLPHGSAHRRLCGTLRAGHGSAHARRWLRLPGLYRHLAHLRQLHLHLLRPGGGHHGAGAAAGAGLAAGVVLRAVLAGHHPHGAARHHLHLPSADLDPAAVGGAVAVALRMVRAGPARFLRAIHRPVRPDLGQQRLRAADVRRSRCGDLRARAADRRAGGLPALHACAHPGQPLALVGRSARGRPGLDLAGHAEDAGRGFSGLRRAAVRHIAAARGRTHADVPGGLPSLAERPHGCAAAHGAVRGDLADQDQRHQRLCRITGMEQLLRAAHAQPPGPRGLAGVQRHHRHAADDTGRLRRARARAGPLRQRGHRLGGRAGRGPGHQQAAGPEPQGRGVSPRLPLRHQPRGPGRDGLGRGAFGCGPLWLAGRIRSRLRALHRALHRHGHGAAAGLGHPGALLPCAPRSFALAGR